MEPTMPILEPKRRLTPKVRIIIAGSVLLIALAVTLIWAMRGSKGTDTKQSPNTTASFYVQSEGYPNQSGIGDAVALFFRADQGGPVTYQGTKVIQACNVLTIDDVRALGLQPRAMQLEGSFKRNYFDGNSQASLNPFQVGLPDGDKANECSYGLENAALVTLNMYQPPYATIQALSNELKKFKKLDPIGELNVYEQQTDAASKRYIIGRGDTGIEVYILKVAADKHRAVIEKVAANLAAERANPKAAPTVVFDSPLIKGAYADACTLLPITSVKQLFGSDVSPLVGQSFANSVGVLKSQQGLYDNNVENKCERRAAPTDADTMTLTSRTVTLEAKTFMNPEAAREWTEFTQTRTKDAVVVQDVGDQAFFFKDIRGPALHVRSGRFVLDISFTYGTAKPSQEQVIQTLRALGQTATALLP